MALGKIGSPSGEALLRALKGEDLARVAEVVDALRKRGASSQQVLALLAGKLEGEAGRELAAKALSDVRSNANAVEAPAGKDWPQWRGPDKDNASKESNLLQVWPKEGPPLAWEVWGIGESIAAVSVREGRVFALGFLNGWEYVTALDARTGRCLWTAALGPGELENSHMRWVAQRTPTAGRERIYVMLASGQLVALRARDGKEEWRVDYLKEFGERQRDYGYVDHPIEEDDRLICTPASGRATLAALELTTGRVRWTSKAPDVPQASCPSTVTMDLAGTRQYVVSAGGLYGFRASDGKFLWSHDGDRMGQGWLVRTPIPSGDSGLLVRGPDSDKVTRLQFPGEGGAPFRPVYTRKQRFGWLQDSSLVSGAWHYVLAGSKLEAVGVDARPEVRSELEHWTGSDASMILADGRLYVLGNLGSVALVEVSGKDMKVKSTFEIPMFVRSSGTSNPVIAQGRLYIRDSDRVLCYDLRARPPSGGSAAPSRAALEPPVPPPSSGPLRAAFVPTPHDVVNRMLSLAKVRAEDTLFDLGSGDGRILLAAAKDYKAKAVGYEIDPELVATSRREVERRGYSEKIRIEEADFLTANLAPATVVALYLPEELMTRLKPQLERLKPGTRIVSHQFRIPGVVADKEETFSSLEDGGRHTVYLWTTPLRSAER
jgi:outer membrane protein assembly factor BamB